MDEEEPQYDEVPTPAQDGECYVEWLEWQQEAAAIARMSYGEDSQEEKNQPGNSPISNKSSQEIDIETQLKLINLRPRKLLTQ